MPGSTRRERREVRLSAPVFQQDALPSMDSILENLEEFKRKHICQNREVIKTNAIAQQRIRELERQVAVLEAEKALAALTTVPMKAELGRLQAIVQRMQYHWQAMGQELSELSVTLGPVKLPSTEATRAPESKKDTQVRSLIGVLEEDESEAEGPLDFGSELKEELQQGTYTNLDCEDDAAYQVESVGDLTGNESIQSHATIPETESLHEGEISRTNRRRSGGRVNYALPKLNTKMRR